MKRLDYTKEKIETTSRKKTNKHCEDPFFKEGVMCESPFSTSTTCFSHTPYITNNVKKTKKKTKKHGCQMLAVSIGCVQAHACDVFLVLVYN